MIQGTVIQSTFWTRVYCCYEVLREWANLLSKSTTPFWCKGDSLVSCALCRQSIFPPSLSFQHTFLLFQFSLELAGNRVYMLRFSLEASSWISSGASMRLRRVLVFIKSESGLRDQTGGRTGPFNKKSVDSDQEWSSPLPNVPVSVLTWVRVAYLSYAKSLAKEDLPKESVSRWKVLPLPAESDCSQDPRKPHIFVFICFAKIFQS
jgi:hypothetical protein